MNSRNGDLILTVDRRDWDGAIQVSIGTEHGGYRLAGPKYDGRGERLVRVTLTDKDRLEIRRYLDQAEAAAVNADRDLCRCGHERHAHVNGTGECWGFFGDGDCPCPGFVQPIRPAKAAL